MRFIRRPKPMSRRAVSLLVGAAMVTTVGGTDVVEGVVLAAAPPVQRPVSAMRADAVDVEPLVTFAQQVEPRVVMRPAESQVDAKGKSLWEISSVGGYGVPSAAMRAYRAAADNTRRHQRGCVIPWTLLAGIGRVESDHGRYGGSALGSDGRPRPAIRGVALNGVGPVAAIRDSDNGRFDGDKVWDRAVGPMQFIPTTWDLAGRDGDRDGVADPNDLDDAALAAAHYLCPDGAPAGAVDWRAQVFRYNHSDYYVDLVMAFERGYRTGDFVIPAPPAPPSVSTGRQRTRGGGGHAADKPGRSRPDKQPSKAQPNKPAKSKPSRSPSRQGKPDPAPKPPAPTKPSKPAEPTKPSKPAPTKPPKPANPTPTPTPTPSPTPTPAPELVQATGKLAGCGSGWCVGGKALAFGSIGTQARSDHDGDGVVEIRSEELAGLDGSTVTVRYRTAGAAVVELQGLPY